MRSMQKRKIFSHFAKIIGNFCRLNFKSPGRFANTENFICKSIHSTKHDAPQNIVACKIRNLPHIEISYPRNWVRLCPIAYARSTDYIAAWILLMDISPQVTLYRNFYDQHQRLLTHGNRNVLFTVIVNS